VSSKGEFEPKHWRTLAGEFFQEAGTLIFVFGLLDPFIQGSPPIRWPAWFQVVLGGSLVFYAFGATVLSHRDAFVARRIIRAALYAGFALIIGGVLTEWIVLGPAPLATESVKR